MVKGICNRFDSFSEDRCGVCLFCGVCARNETVEDLFLSFHFLWACFFVCVVSSFLPNHFNLSFFFRCATSVELIFDMVSITPVQHRILRKRGKLCF